MHMQPPSDAEFDTLPHIVFTSGVNWDLSRYVPVPCVFETFISKQVCHKQKSSVYMFTESCVHVSGIGLIICIPI
jgi:hypothetical protein